MRGKYGSWSTFRAYVRGTGHFGALYAPFATLALPDAGRSGPGRRAEFGILLTASGMLAATNVVVIRRSNA
jgi:hypothetical protein